MPNKEGTIAAQVVLYNPKQKSLLDEQQITSGNIEALSPDKKNIGIATSELQKLGFTCNAVYPTLSISGPQTLFENTFHLQFETVKRNSTPYIKAVTKPIIPEPLKTVIADIVFGEPMEPLF